MLTQWKPIKKLTTENLQGELDNITNTLQTMFAQIRISGTDECLIRHLWEVEGRLARWIVSVEAFSEKLKLVKTAKEKRND